MGNRYFAKILIFVLIVVIVVIIFNQGFIRNTLQDSSSFFEKAKDNFSSQFDKKRSAPITLIEKEENLRLFMGPLVHDFTQEDWDRFWNVIYGMQEKPADNPFLPKEFYQYSIEQAQDQLRRMFPGSFGRLGPEHWSYIWREIIKTN